LYDIRGKTDTKIIFRFQVLKAATNQPLPNPKVPNDFFALSSTDVKKEQQAKSDEVDRVSTVSHSLLP
jgi:hypothetical protein